MTTFRPLFWSLHHDAHEWGLASSDKCSSGMIQTMSVTYSVQEASFMTADCKDCTPPMMLQLTRGKSGSALGGTEYRLMPSACRQPLWNLRFRYLVSRAPMRRRSIVVILRSTFTTAINRLERIWQQRRRSALVITGKLTWVTAYTKM